MKHELVGKDDVWKIRNGPAGVCDPDAGFDFEYPLCMDWMGYPVCACNCADGDVHLEDFFPKHQPPVRRKPEVPSDDRPGPERDDSLDCTDEGFKDPSALSMPGVPAENQGSEGKGKNSDYLPKMSA